MIDSSNIKARTTITHAMIEMNDHRHIHHQNSEEEGRRRACKLPPKL